MCSRRRFVARYCEPKAHSGLQDLVAAAPLNLVYVAHGERMLDVFVEETRQSVSAEKDRGSASGWSPLARNRSSSPRCYSARLIQ